MDFQLCRYGHPINDLVFYFYCASGPADLDRYRDFLEMYSGALGNKLRALGHSDLVPQDLLHRLLEKWHRSAMLALTSALIMVRIMLTDSDEAVDLESALESGSDLSESFGHPLRDQRGYELRIKAIVRHLIVNGIH